VFGDPKLFEVGPFPVTETMLVTLGVSMVLVLVAVLFISMRSCSNEPARGAEITAAAR